MRIRFLGLSCAGLALLCVGVAAVAAFLGAILVGQSVSDVSFPVSAATATVLSLPVLPLKTAGFPALLPSDEPAIGVTLVAPDMSAPSEVGTATPGDRSLPGSATATPSASPFMPDVPLGTLDYPLTVTAQAHVMGTQVNTYLGSVDATRTEAARRVIPTHLALTLTASSEGK